MNNDDKVIYEVYFQSEGLSESEYNYYLSTLLHTKEITDSERRTNETSSSSFDMVMMSLRKNVDNSVSFSGAITNGDENRTYDGIISRKGNKTVVFTEVCRLGLSTTYNVVDSFKTKGSKVTRQTIYSDTPELFESIFDEFDMDEVERFKQSKVDFHKGPSKKLANLNK